MSGIVHRPYCDGDEPALRDMFRAVYGLDAERRTSAWRYLAPAPYPAVIQVAEADGRIVGAQPSHAIDLLIDGAPTQGLLLLDVMTHPGYRRRGVFAGVVEGLRARAATEGYRVLLTTPNRDAERGFARLPIWRKLGELVPWVFAADPRALAAGDSGWGRLLQPLVAARRRFGPAVSPNHDHPLPAEPTDSDIETVWADASGVTRCQVVRDARFLRWRFGGGSGRGYRILCHGSGARPQAVAVMSVGRLLGRKVLFIADIIHPPAALEAARRLLRQIAGMAVAEGAAAAVGWFAPRSPAESALRSAGFHALPRLLRPRPYVVWGWTDLPSPSDGLVLDVGSWHMSLADSDLA